MKIVADENIDSEIVSRLRADGHEVIYVSEESPGIDDQSVLSRSVQTDGVLLTADKDFGDIVFRLRQVHAGVLLVRLGGIGADRKAALVSAAFNDHGNELSSGFAVLSDRSLRFRNTIQ